MLQCASVGAKTRSAKEAILLEAKMTMIKKFSIGIMAAIFAVVLCLAFAGCAPGNYNKELKEAQLHTPDILEEGKLKVGVNFGNPPMAGDTAKASGIDIDVASAIAEDLGLEVEIVDCGTTPETALSEKKCDILMGVPQSSNLSDVWKSEPYIQTASALFAKDSDAPVPVKGGADKFASEMASSSAISCQAQFDVANIKLDSTISAAFEDLSNGAVKYVAADAIIGSYNIKENNIEASMIALLNRPSGFCACALSSNSKLTEKIKGSMETLSKGGVFLVIEKRWLGRALELDTCNKTAEADNQPDNGQLEAGVYAQATEN